MWIFTVHGFFSVVEKNKGLVEVRARDKTHLKNLVDSFDVLRSAEIVQTPKADYCCRIIIPKADWSVCLKTIGDEIDYDNFKNKCHDFFDDQYMQSLMRVWATMAASRYDVLALKKE